MTKNVLQRLSMLITAPWSRLLFVSVALPSITRFSLFYRKRKRAISDFLPLDGEDDDAHITPSNTR
jgi:hypothetical protein